MKALLLVIISAFCVNVMAQDSTQIKLQRYKDLHDQGLITDKEYSDLKGVELDLKSVPAKKDTVDLDKLERSYKTQLTTGGIALVGTFGCLAGFIVKKDKYSKYTILTGEPKNNYLKEARICLVFSGILAGISTYSFVKGSKSRRKYITLSGSPIDVSMNVTF